VTHADAQGGGAVMGDWLKNLKAGDEVAVFNGYPWNIPTIETVDRTTATLIVVGGARFRRRDGCAPGDSWSRNRIRQPTQEHRDLAENHVLRQKLDRVIKSTATTLETLRAMYAATQPEAQAHD
jgi:hypothetical protein